MLEIIQLLYELAKNFQSEGVFSLREMKLVKSLTWMGIWSGGLSTGEGGSQFFPEHYLWVPQQGGSSTRGQVRNSGGGIPGVGNGCWGGSE